MKPVNAEIDMENFLENEKIDLISSALRPLKAKLLPRDGWIKTIREILGMTSIQLAARLDVHPSRITRMENDELRHAITLQTLYKTAEALDCDLVYAFVPKKSIHDMLRERARLVAEPRLKALQHSMALEEQSLTSEQLQSALDRYIDQLLQEPLKYLWEDNNNENNSNSRSDTT